jgi:uncharacterized protein YyaL (SSP411 family)
MTPSHLNTEQPMSDPVFTNRLAHETSPYLRQHRHNPVDWYPWGPEALARARQLDRPIFLSIGYAACHWCHVMEHESFENQEIAKILNDHFVSIKVDREERPDLDQIYMTSVQLLTGQGGWPMSVFLTPDLRPFTGGTYFPPDDRYGRPGFKRLLLTVADWWKTRRGEVDEAAVVITDALRNSTRLRPQEGGLDDALLRQAADVLARAFDPQNGGFGAAPKFPHPMDLRVLLRAWRRFADENALHMVRHTLDRMAMGGIYDHLGGGFARYSTDARWLVPHFEKMLYDNALLVPCYLEAFQVTGDAGYRNVVDETLAWVTREMTSPEGPFYSTLDADSEGVEGKFYVWTAEEIEKILGADDAADFSSVYGVVPDGNWHDPHGHAPARANILHRTKTFVQLARLHRIGEGDLRRLLELCRRKLLDARTRRVRPGLDDKALTSWNALMIGAFARAAQVLDNAEYAAAAVKAANFMVSRMRAPDGRLLRSFSSGAEPKLNAYLEDYAFLIDALVTLYETDFDVRWITAALELSRVMTEQFWDEAEGGFFYTGRDHESLIVRNKDATDNAIPSGNAMAATGLLRLAKLTGRDDLRDQAERTLKLYQGLMAEHPMAAGQMLLALDFYLGPTQEIAIVGQTGADDTRRVLTAVRSGFRPNEVVAFKDPGAGAEVERVVLLLADKAGQGGVTTYVCEDFVCKEPLVGAEAAEAALK